MILYEVNIEIDERIRSEFLIWLKSHIEEMEEVPGILPNTQFFWDLEQKNKASIHYLFKNQEYLDSYIDQLAPEMRGRLPDRFKEYLVFSRRCLVKTSK